MKFKSNQETDVGKQKKKIQNQIKGSGETKVKLPL
jgi:hypothetical protein